MTRGSLESSFKSRACLHVLLEFHVTGSRGPAQGPHHPRPSQESHYVVRHKSHYACGPSQQSHPVVRHKSHIQYVASSGIAPQK